MTIYKANDVGQPIDDNGNVVPCEYSLFNGVDVYVFDSYEEWEQYVYQLNLLNNPNV